MLETDVKPSQGRLSIPFHKLIQNDFLTTPVESRITSTAKKKWCLGVVLVDQVSQEMGDERFLELRFGLWVERCREG